MFHYPGTKCKINRNFPQTLDERHRSSCLLTNSRALKALLVGLMGIFVVKNASIE